MAGSAVKCKRFRKKRLATNPRFFADQINNWRARNPEKWRAIVARAKRKRYRRSLHDRLITLVGGGIRKAVRKNRGVKSARTLELLGTTIADLRKWLQDQFQDGMNWSNMGRFGWHIDHVRPCASFDLTDPEQQRACFHYTNLQPLWWRDNLSKGAKC